MRRTPRKRPIHPDRQAEMYVRRVGPYLAELHHKTEAAVERALRIANVISDAEGITTDHIIAQVLRDVPRDVQAVAV